MMKVITSKYLQLKIQNVLPVVAIFAVFLPTPILASSVNIYRQITDKNIVTLKVRVTDDNNVPIEGLTKKSFVVETTDRNGNPIDTSDVKFQVIPPEKKNYDPAYAIILLDMSGSMKHDDLGGKQKRKKLEGATQAIQKFIEKAREEKIPVQISLAPFGYIGDAWCGNLYPLNKDTIDNDAPFLEVTDKDLDSQLKDLSKVPVCAATNLYKPLEAAASYLRSQVEENNSIVNTDKIPPRLIAILLSDGYDKDSSEERTQELINILTQQPQITVHTLGYGESLKQLRDRADCSRYIPDDELSPSTLIDKYNNCRLPKSEGDITEYIIDERQLQQIANGTGGINELSGDADTVVENFIKILKTFREYEIVYQQPDADQGTFHTTTIRVKAPGRGLNLSSEEKQIRISNYNYQSLPFDKRLGIFVLTFLLVLAGAIPFFRWSKRLKEQAENYLEY